MTARTTVSPDRSGLWAGAELGHPRTAPDNKFWRVLGAPRSQFVILKSRPTASAPTRWAISGMMGGVIGRMHHVVLDCPDPAALAAFYSAVLGLPVTYRDDDWVVVAASHASSGLAFQRAADNQRPTWPDPAVPQQFHLDIMVEEPAVAGPRVLALGAVKLGGENVYADPAGHPFCLIRRPRWAAPIPADD